MNDLIPIALFIGCLFATFGLLRVCEWLKPATSAQRSDPGGGNEASTSTNRREEGAR